MNKVKEEVELGAILPEWIGPEFVAQYAKPYTIWDRIKDGVTNAADAVTSWGFGRGNYEPWTEAQMQDYTTVTLNPKAPAEEGSFWSGLWKTASDLAGGWLSLEGAKAASKLEQEKLKLQVEMAKWQIPTITIPSAAPPKVKAEIPWVPILATLAIVGTVTGVALAKKR